MNPKYHLKWIGGMTLLSILAAVAFSVGCGKPRPVLTDAEVITKTHYCEANGMDISIMYQDQDNPWASDGIVAAYCVPPRKEK